MTIGFLLNYFIIPHLCIFVKWEGVFLHLLRIDKRFTIGYNEYISN